MTRIFASLAVIAFVLAAGCGSVQRMNIPGVGGNMTAGAQAQWSTTATDHRGANGQRFAYNCPPGGMAHTVWGSEVYSDDSSVCTAGVHAGAISLASGGRVVIEIRPGQSSYRGSDWNGIVSQDWGEWSGSFVVLN
jgi:hypothetical protein